MNSRRLATYIIITILIVVAVFLISTTYLHSKSRYDQNADVTTVNTTSQNASTTPTASASPLPVVRNANIIISRDDFGKTIHMKIGDEFLLSLGSTTDSNLVWKVTLDDSNVIEEVRGDSSIEGQGIFTAHKSGKTTITAQGKPHCDPNEACPQLIAQFNVKVVVDPPEGIHLE